MSRRTGLGLLVFVVALTLRVAYIREHAEVLQLDVSRLTQTDNYIFSQWAQLIAAGDLLCREQPHAFHYWTGEVAPEERWLEWYGGPLTFHQAPLYPYCVALVYRLAGVDDVAVGYVQAVLGALTCWLTFLLASRLLGLRTGVIAGLLLAFMGPYYFFDAFVLRDGPMAFLIVLTTLALDVAVQRRRARDWLLAGAALGLVALAKETGGPLLALTLLVVAWTLRRDWPALLRTASLLVLGFALVTAPAYVRNAVVGAPTFSLSTRGPEVFIAGNAHGQTGVGWNPPIELMRELLMESNFSLPRAMLLTLATHRADPWGLLALEWGKLSAYLSSYEVPNNVNYYLHRAHLTSLKLGFVSMAFITPAMLLGLILGLARRRRLGVVYLMLLTVSASVVALYILARFRLQALPLMAIFAALSVDWALRAWSERRHAALVLAALPFMLFTWWSWGESDPYREDNKNTSIMLQLAKTGNFARALEFRDRLVEALADDRELQIDAGTSSKLATIQAAFDRFAEGMAAGDGSAAGHKALADGYAQLVPITKRGDMREFVLLAQQHYERAMELDPQLEGVRHGLGMLEASVENHFENQDAQKNFGNAYRWFMRELEVHPCHGPSHRDAGRLHLAWEQWALALEHFMQAEACGTVDGEILAGIARLSVDPRLSGTTRMTVGGQTLPVVDRERAATYVERALELAPDAPNVLNFASDVYYLLGRYDECIALLDRLVELQPWRGQELTQRREVMRALRERAAATGAAPGSAPAPQDGTSPVEPGSMDAPPYPPDTLPEDSR